MGGLTARSNAAIDDPFSGRRRPDSGQRPYKNHTRAPAPAPALGAGALGPGGLGPEGLGPLGALGRLGARARGNDSHAAMLRCATGADAGTAPAGLLSCLRGGAAFGPCPPALLPAPRAGEAGHTLGQGLRQRCQQWEKSAARICAAGGPSGKIGSADLCPPRKIGSADLCPPRKIGSADLCPSRKIGSADFLTNMGWTLGWPGQAGKFV